MTGRSQQSNHLPTLGLSNVINRPASECTGNAIYIGPTKVDLSEVIERERLAARDRAIQAQIRKREAGIFKSWRASDFATYSYQQKRFKFRRSARTD